jgi:trans-aconitate methyltransferase
LRLLDTTSPIKDKIIADYGCGVGLSLELESEFQIRLVGFDYSARMRKIASERGMRVLSQKDLSCQPEGVFDGAFASYVFQLYPRPCELTDFWRLLKPGAALVANFHKNQGIDFVNDSLKLLRCSIRVLPTTTGAEPHGAYIAYVKNM